MSNGIHSITVIGGTGMLGKPVVRQLVQDGYRITAMVRDHERAKGKLPEEVRLVQGDLQNRQDIAGALEDAEAVYLNLSTRPEIPRYADFVAERDGLENILSVVSELNAGKPRIRRVAAISSLVQRYQGMNNFDWWVFQIKKWAIEALKTSDVPTTIFYPSTFMETFDQGGMLQGRRIMLAGKSKQPMYFIAGSDYGRMVAESFKMAEDVDYEFDIQGPEPLTFDEAAMIFIKNYRHGPVKVTNVPIWPLKLAGLINNEVQYLSRIMEALNNYPETWAGYEGWRKLGRPKLTLAEYAQQL